MPPLPPRRLQLCIRLEIRDSRFTIHVSRFKKKSMKIHFKKKYQILENQSMFPQYSYYKAFIWQKICTLQCRGFSRKISKVWPVVLLVCLKSELWHQIDLKISLVKNWIYLTTVATIYKSLLKKNCCSLSLWFRVKISKIPLLRLLFWINFINITVITLN